MKYARLIFLFCLFGCGTSFAQTIAPKISASNCDKPEYPIASRRLTEEGTVQLKFLVGLDGRVIESLVEKSSGFKQLDEAARRGLAKCNFVPGSKNGVAFESWASMKYTWKLDVFSPCEGNDVSKWMSCLGTLSTPSGGLSVVEYEMGKKSGRGIEYDVAGKVIRAGIFDGENLVARRNLDAKLYPFKALLPINLVNQNQNLGVTQLNIYSSSLPTCQSIDYHNLNNCFGSHTFPDGAKYSGEWRAMMMHGRGTFTFANGVKYVGEWKDNNYSGQGTLFASDGSVIRQGIWADGNFVRALPLSHPDVSNQTATIIAAQTDASEKEKLLSEVEAERKKQRELEDQLRVAQQSGPTNTQVSTFALERRVALVLGNATYKVNPLKNPVNDSSDMAISLRSVGFDVIEAKNTTLAQMREVTRRFADKLVNSDVGLVYYSGHGVEVKGKNYLIPVNADIKREYEVVDQAFDASQFLEMMDNIRGPNNKRVNILIVDACRNNELQKSWRSTNNGLARMDAPGGTFISFATAPGRVAADGIGRNSPYTKHLLQALKQPNVPIEQVFKVVRRNVMEETKGEQIPWENSSLVGDFYFTVQR